MAEQVRRKSTWSSWSRLERLALLSTILIWAGVISFGVGLFVALRNLHANRIAYAQIPSATPTAIETATPSPTPLIFPAGWSTATPTTTAVPTRTRPAKASIHSEILVSSTIAVTTTPTATPPPTRRPEVESAPPTLKPPDRLAIPAIKLDSPIVPIGWHTLKEDGLPSRVWEVADYVVGWHKTSAYPGSMGNVVLNGHHNIKGEVFRYLVDLEVGDRVLVYVGDQEYHYAVAEKHILKEKGEPPEVRRQNASWIGPTADERLTMITCWPYTNNTHRLVVVANPAPALELSGLER
jgi:sortase A